MTKTYDLTAIGNALVDVLAQASESFIEEQHRRHGMVKGSMTLIGEERAVSLYDEMGAALEMSGGSAGNTMAGFASFGGAAGAYIGKVADDQLGEVFRHDLRSIGVDFDTPVLRHGAATGRCLVLITPDAERTMNTYLGAAVELGPDDVNAAVIAASRVTYLEGYLFDRPEAKKAYLKASDIAHAARQRVSLTLSDTFCVERHRDDFRDLIHGHVDILFANEDELKSLFQTEDLAEAITQIRGRCEIAAITRGEAGSVIVSGNDTVEIAAEPVHAVVDTTGAGDQYAAGFLYGFAQGYDLARCGKLASMAASEVIGHVGPRPLASYRDFLRKVA